MLKKIISKYKKNKIIFSINAVLIVGMVVSLIWAFSTFNNETQGGQFNKLKLPDPIETNQKSKRELQESRIISNREFGSTLNGHEFIKESKKIELNGQTSDNTNSSYSASKDSTANTQAGDIMYKTNTAVVARDSMMQHQEAKEKEKTQIQKLEEQIAELKTTNEIHKQREQTEANIKQGILGRKPPGTISQAGSKAAQKGQAMDTGSSNTLDNEASARSKPIVGGLNAPRPMDAHALGMIKTLQETLPEARVLTAGKGYSIITKGGRSKKVAANTVTAVVDQDHTLYDGSLLQIRLLAPVDIGGITIPINYYIYGYASFQAERLSVQFSSIELDGDIYPFNAKVYDFDGLEGLDAPGTKDANIAKGSSAEALKSTEVETSTYNKGVLESAVSSVTTGAVNTVKQIGTLKILQQKIKIKAGHKLLLVIKKNQNQ